MKGPIFNISTQMGGYIVEHTFIAILLIVLKKILLKLPVCEMKEVKIFGKKDEIVETKKST